MKYCPSALFDLTINRKWSCDGEEIELKQRHDRENGEVVERNKLRVPKRTTACTRIGGNVLIRTEELTATTNADMSKAGLPNFSDNANEGGFSSEADDHAAVADKCDLISLVRQNAHPSAIIADKLDGIETLGLVDGDGDVDLTGIEFNNVLRDDFSNEVNKIWGTSSTPDPFSEQITIASHEYHVGSLEYLAHDEWDCS